MTWQLLHIFALDAPTEPQKPVDFMGSPVEILNDESIWVLDEVDAILSIDPQEEIK